MEVVTIDGLKLIYHPHDSQAVQPVHRACQRSIELIRSSWGLEPAQDCQVTIMTSLLGFTFGSAPWPWKILLALSLPLWYPRQARLWPAVGGYAQRYGRRYVVGVKPPRLIVTGDSALGDKIFIREDDHAAKVQSITCHELTHAFSDHLQLPDWLKEGLAMVTVDRYFERTTVKPETLNLLKQFSEKMVSQEPATIPVSREDILLQEYIYGYWFTRYLESTQPGLLKNLLGQQMPGEQIESEIAVAYGLKRDELRGEMGAMIVSHYT
ncbi:MAG: hypothetical protein JSV61_07435 [Anaerolineales bacterium]|nr:MAG: hypothetical protein JSV61_07435 [Anaerolineales bacterium]